ncbi:hypothetical protein EV363DRAFT_1396564 [Boletus edulis]|nr:hypothetical protein EV363DRAFT_1396564 [Boletus edulis]
MVLYPEVQAKAQAELDSLIGNEHHFHTDAILHELVDGIARQVLTDVLRIPHATSSDDVYGDEGYHIPKGTVVPINV